MRNVRGVVHTIHDSGLLRLAEGLDGDTLAAAGGFAVLISAKGLELRAVQSNNLVWLVNTETLSLGEGCTDKLAVAHKGAACTAVGHGSILRMRE
jgi:hypothetical protein